MWNTPVQSSEEVSKDLGIYAQDSMKFRRFSISPGLRFEWFASQVNPQEAPAGRFVPARTFPEREIAPKWFDVSPRLGIVYDLFGDAKTAIKYDVGKYVHNLTLSLADRYNPMFATTDTPVGRLLPEWPRRPEHMRVRIRAAPTAIGSFQDWEMGRAAFRTLDLVCCEFDGSRLEARLVLRMGLSVDHELSPRLGVSAGWYHTDYINMRTY